MRTMNTDVESFHKKHGFPCNMDLRSNRVLDDTSILLDICKHLAEIAEKCKQPGLNSQHHGDERLYRTHLMVEELSEVIHALAVRDEIALADGTADLRYVVTGTDVTYGIPSEYVDEEVHASNMSKSVRSKADPRMKNKGLNYRPPNIARAISLGRSAKNWHRNLEQEQP